jgi:hypothetical protein
VRVVAGAVLVGALIVAGAIVFVGRWQIAGGADPQRFEIYRLDRWSGHVEYCGLDPRMDPRTAKSAQIVCPLAAP